MYSLEKYRGSKNRFSCPSCGHKNVFAKYISETGEYMDETVGRCNREVTCGYHQTPKEWFSVHDVRCSRPEHLNKLNAKNKMNASNTLNTVNKMNTVNASNTFEHREQGEQPEQFSTIDNSFVVRSLAHTAKNRFLNYLLELVDREHVESALKKYFVGTTKDGRTVYWLIDREGRARTGKIISYDQNSGKRRKSVHPTWIHSELMRAKVLPGSFQSKICCFGEHLLKTEKEKPIAIVEAEKTAVIASMFIDKFVWLAIGARGWLKTHKLQFLGKRRIVLYPDGDAFELWSQEADQMRKIGMNVEVSDFIEKHSTGGEKRQGFDLADHLIRAELYAQDWNGKVTTIESSAELNQRFAQIYYRTFKPNYVLNHSEQRTIVNQIFS